ncbi:hypothetical protein HPB50_011279 [Hyalomma asiaticum]|uniref:Uncharacterized protein n=1 Tax=Hyalomma asiaticum TaxID=266040 RepID=A0ACB7TFU2_HYAAI|nr:hypothetical protein HPB50_011279 [Hyalomma asiaticum]
MRLRGPRLTPVLGKKRRKQLGKSPKETGPSNKEEPHQDERSREPPNKSRCAFIYGDRNAFRMKYTTLRAVKWNRLIQYRTWKDATLQKELKTKIQTWQAGANKHRFIVYGVPVPEQCNEVMQKKCTQWNEKLRKVCDELGPHVEFVSTTRAPTGGAHNLLYRPDAAEALGTRLGHRLCNFLGLQSIGPTVRRTRPGRHSHPLAPLMTALGQAMLQMAGKQGQSGVTHVHRRRRHHRGLRVRETNVGLLNVHGARKPSKWEELYAMLDSETMELYALTDAPSWAGGTPSTSKLGMALDGFQDFNGDLVDLTARDLNLEIANLRDDCEGEFTWCARNSRSCIDYVLISPKLSRHVTSVTIDEDGKFSVGSDHNRMKLTFSTSTWRQKRRDRREPAARYLPEETYENIAQEFEGRLMNLESPSYDQFVQALHQIMQTHEVCVNSRGGVRRKPWWDKEVQVALTTRREANRLHRKASCGRYLDCKRDMQAIVQRKIAEHNGEQLKAIIEDKRKGSRRLWTYVSSLDRRAAYAADSE